MTRLVKYSLLILFLTIKVIAQDPWFGERLSFNNLKDLLPEDWIVEKIPEDRIQK